MKRAGNQMDSRAAGQPPNAGRALNPTLVILEDHPILRQALVEWIRREPGLTLVGEAGDGPAGLELCLRTRPWLVVMDLGLPLLDGLGVAEQLRKTLPDTRILALTGREDALTIWRLHTLRVEGYLERAQPLEILQAAVRTVIEGGTYHSVKFRDTIARLKSDPDAFHKILSGRELSVLQLVAKGQPDEAISVTLGVTIQTVNTHRRNIRRKLNLHNDRELIAYAREWGL